MAVISGVLKGPMGDALEGVVIELRALRTSATVITQERSSSVTNAAGRYSLTVEPGDYSVFISAFGRTPENRGSISVKLNSATGTLNDFLLIPGESDLNPEIVATVDGMRAAAAASAAAAKTSENNAAAAMTNALSKTVTTDQAVAGAVAFSKSVTLGGALSMGGGLSIDDNTLPSGNYYANMATEGTRPEGTYGHLTVIREGTTGASCRQMWNANTSADVWVRIFVGSSWSAWRKLWNSINLANPLKVGDYGLGNPYTPTVTDLSAQLTNQWWHASGTTTAPNTGLWAGISGGYDAVSRWNMAFLQGGTTVDLRVQVIKNGVAGAWAALWHTTNTTVDANGFIKKASPIVKLFGDGQCELNDQSQGVTTERVSEGVYRISGTLGFNADAEWGGVDGGIEIPTDRNKLPLVWVDYEVDETGDLLIKTFHRVNSTAPKFAQNVKVGYKEGQPIDIPAGRWIDLRVEMPGVDEPEYIPEPEPEDDVILEPEMPEVTELEGGEEPAPGDVLTPN
ncbi:phage tail fiber protein [Serratia fonticola]|uniref:phage tail fiber protein n=1 Tax=Serratia fonticola TaxID=47917 RepID=UPI001FD727D7|nr:prophage tail fiber N-terminal domain-containing protein [Serratia fonticola]